MKISDKLTNERLNELSEELGNQSVFPLMGYSNDSLTKKEYFAIEVYKSMFANKDPYTRVLQRVNDAVWFADLLLKRLSSDHDFKASNEVTWSY